MKNKRDRRIRVGEKLCARSKNAGVQCGDRIALDDPSPEVPDSVFFPGDSEVFDDALKAKAIDKFWVARRVKSSKPPPVLGQNHPLRVLQEAASRQKEMKEKASKAVAEKRNCQSSSEATHLHVLEKMFEH